MGGRFFPLGIPLRLVILLLPLLVGGLVTFRAVRWAQLPPATEGTADLTVFVGPPEVKADPVVESVRERGVVASSREAERRPEPVQVLPVEASYAHIEDLVPPKYRALVLETATRHGLDPRLLAAVIRLESRYDPTVVGNHGEVGLMQILADTGAWLATVAGMESYDLRKDETSLELGALYLKINLREHGSVEKALAVYNGGPRAAAGWETNIYVLRVMEFYRGRES